MGSFTDNLMLTTGMLGLKMMACHALTIRARFMAGTFKTKEDAQFGPGGGMKWLGDVFKVLLGAYGPTVPLDRLLAIVNNSNENEPVFFAAALMLAHKSPSKAMADAVLYYGIARLLHAVCYLAQLQPFRALSYLAGVGITSWFSAALFIKADSSAC